MRLTYLLWLGLALSLAAACQPRIGDSCAGSRDCSATGQRQCDLTQPGGYCTVKGCDADTCPDGAICVEWRFNPTRTAETWCMRGCRENSGCRDRGGYSCVAPSRITANGESLADTCRDNVPTDEQIARVIDLDAERSLASICTAVTEIAPTCPDGEPPPEEPAMVPSTLYEESDIQIP
ncbi:MAG: hypothetical protein WBG86_13150 [Polyangiales bacterium]